MKYTKFGREVYAIGGNAQSAMMMGLNVKKTKFKAYVLDGLLAGCGSSDKKEKTDADTAKTAVPDS